MFRSSLALLAACLGLSAAPAQAQLTPWAQSRPFTFTANSNRVSSAVAPLGDGGMWWAAPKEHHQINGQHQLGTVELVKYHRFGSTTFQTTIAGNVTVGRLVAMPDSGVCLVGGFSDSLVFSDGARLWATGVNLDYFVARLASDGQVQWLRSLHLPGSSGISGADALAVDPRTGDVWVGYDNYSNSYLTRFGGLTGDSLTTYVQRDVNRVVSLDVAPDGTLYVASSCAGTNASYNGLAAPTQLAYSDALACYAPNGQARWVRYVESITCGKSYVAVSSDSGRVFWAGSLSGVRQFGNLSAGRPGALFGDFFLTQLDRATGSFQWVRNLPGSTTVTLAPQGALAADGIGRCWLLLTVLDTALVYPGVGGHWRLPVGGGSALVSFDRGGQFDLGLAPYGRLNRAHSLAITRNPGVGLGAISGLAPQGDLDLWGNSVPPAPAGTMMSFASPFYVVALLGTGQEAAASQPLHLAPNPVAAGGRVLVEQVLSGAPATVEIRDAVGRLVVRHSPLTRAESSFAAPTTPGLYAVRLSAAGRSVMRKLVVE